MTRMRILLAVLLACLVATEAQAATITYGAVLSGAAETPPNASPGTGWAIVTYDTDTSVLTIEALFADLIGTTTAAHIHCCTALPVTGTAGVATQVPSFPGFPLDVTSGSYNAAFDLTLPSSYNPAFVTANGGVAGARSVLLAGLDAGTTYFNIHTTFRPAGEIRGFLEAGLNPVPVPEPASLGLVALGLAAVAARRWRKRA